MENNSNNYFVGIGYPIVDLYVNVNEEIINEYNLVFDETNIITEEFQLKFINDLSSRYAKAMKEPVLGGSTYNTLRIFNVNYIFILLKKTVLDDSRK